MFKDFYFNVEIVGERDNCGFMPERAHDTDAGMDVFTPIDCIVPAGEAILIPLNIKFEFKNAAAIVKEKSSVATKKRLSVGACLIDENYRGIVHVHLFNHQNINVSFKRGDKIAQLIVVPVWTGQPNKVESVDMNTDRGEGGFGSTGESIYN